MFDLGLRSNVLYGICVQLFRNVSDEFHRNSYFDTPQILRSWDSSVCVHFVPGGTVEKTILGSWDSLVCVDFVPGGTVEKTNTVQTSQHNISLAQVSLLSKKFKKNTLVFLPMGKSHRKKAKQQKPNTQSTIHPFNLPPRNVHRLFVVTWSPVVSTVTEPVHFWRDEFDQNRPLIAP